MRPVIFQIFRSNPEINKYYPVIHDSEVLRLDVLVDIAKSMHFFYSLNHLG
jgi:hypothetical protein